MTSSIESTSSENTEQLGQQLGQNCRGGEVVELVSDLGGGKTTLTRGIAKGIGSEDKVASPTFTISKVYTGKELELHHFDFYRLQEPGIVAHELSEVIDDPRNVIVIEWGEIVSDVLPASRLTIHLQRSGEDSRQFIFSCPKELQYLMKNMG